MTRVAPEPPVTAAIQVVVVEDHPSMRRGLELLLADRGFRVVGAAGSAREGKAMVAARRPDVAVLDLELGDDSGASLTAAVAAGAPDTAVVIYTGLSSARLLDQALTAGASGLVLKTSPVDDLARAITSAAAGAAFIDQRASRILSHSAIAEHPALTKREAEVLTLLAGGLGTRQVAGQLFLSEDTVETHVRNATRKLGARGRLHAVITALARGELDFDAIAAAATEQATP